MPEVLPSLVGVGADAAWRALTGVQRAQAEQGGAVEALDGGGEDGRGRGRLRWLNCGFPIMG